MAVPGGMYGDLTCEQLGMFGLHQSGKGSWDEVTCKEEYWEEDGERVVLEDGTTEKKYENINIMVLCSLRRPYY